MTGDSRQRSTNVLMGRWRIVEMDLWEQDNVDLVAPGFIESGKDHKGSLGFIAVSGFSAEPMETARSRGRTYGP
jgi:hypothetical protein